MVCGTQGNPREAISRGLKDTLEGSKALIGSSSGLKGALKGPKLAHRELKSTQGDLRGVIWGSKSAQGGSKGLKGVLGNSLGSREAHVEVMKENNEKKTRNMLKKTQKM